MNFLLGSRETYDEEEFREVAGEDGWMSLDEFFKWGFKTVIEKHNFDE